jgi:putative phosphoesterase
MRIGLLSDTHVPSGRFPLWPEVYEAFRGVDRIFHLGDIFIPAVLDWLEEVAPVLAVRGNNDSFDTGDPRFKDRHILEIEGLRVGLIHILEPYDRPVDWLLQRYFGQTLDVVVFGDTHYELVEERDGVLFVNPGSPTYPRNMERRLGTVGILEVNGGRASAEIIQLK